MRKAQEKFQGFRVCFQAIRIIVAVIILILLDFLIDVDFISEWKKSIKSFLNTVPKIYIIIVISFVFYWLLTGALNRTITWKRSDIEDIISKLNDGCLYIIRIEYHVGHFDPIRVWPIGSCGSYGGDQYEWTSL